ncbi:MAG: dihydroorotase family protein [Nitrososphaerota archaeon]
MSEEGRIDPHVHCRDWGESYKSTIREVFSLARSQGVSIIFDMPNTEPPITNRELVERRLRTAAEQGVKKGYYLYVAATRRLDQLEEAVRTVEEEPRVVGLKMYTAQMKGIEVENPEDQLRVYRALADMGYKGVIAVHCEKTSLFKTEKWSPNTPSSWNLARPPESEVEAVRDQINAVRTSGFRGTLHIVHVSTPGAIELISRARQSGVRVVCGVTPHHLMMSTRDMEGPNGLLLKVNPPLREPEDARGILEALRRGEIDFIETDHAPHTLQEKLNPPYLSGIRSLEKYSQLISWLVENGFPEKLIDDLTNRNIVRTFGVEPP